MPRQAGTAGSTELQDRQMVQREGNSATQRGMQEARNYRQMPCYLAASVLSTDLKLWAVKLARSRAHCNCNTSLLVGSGMFFFDESLLHPQASDCYCGAMEV